MHQQTIQKNNIILPDYIFKSESKCLKEMDKEAETAGQRWPVAFYLADLVQPTDYTQIPRMVEDRKKVVHSHQQQDS
jgi:hypothetical protein